jgi:L-ribulose-5-phosphate 3-epimerase
MIKTAIFDWFGYILSMEERYKLIKVAGYDGTMIWWGFIDEAFNIEKHKNPEIARKQGLFIENIHTPFISSNDIWCDNLNGENYAKMLMDCVSDCNIHKIPKMVVHLSEGANPSPVSKIGMNRVKSIIGKAEELGIFIALENLRINEHLRYIFDNVQSEYLGFCFDSGHQNCRTPNEDVLSTFTEDQHKLPFDGTINWLQLMIKLKDIGYNEPISLEITNYGYESMIDKPYEFLKIAYERVLKLKNLLEN